MKHTMRRFRQQLPVEEVVKILHAGSSGILSLVDTDGEPYGVPMSYSYDGRRSIYFHSALSGHKMRCLENDSRCSFCVVAQDMVVPEEFTTYFRSVIVKGRIHILKERSAMLEGLLSLCRKYSPGVDATAELAKGVNHVTVLRLDIETMTRKQAIELVRTDSAS